MNRNYKFFVAFAIAVVTLLIATALWLLKISTTGGPEQKREADAVWIDTEAEEIVFEPVETEAETETVFEPVTEAETETVFEPVIEPETEAETKTAIPDTSDVAPKMNDETKPYSDDDLLYLAKIVHNEAGSDFCTDAHQRAVASVVLNRVADPRFPDTIIGVITQGWNGECALQYAVGGWDRFNALVPSERAIENARYVLEHGSTVPGAIWQAEFPQGTAVLATFSYPEIYSSVTYICR